MKITHGGPICLVFACMMFAKPPHSNAQPVATSWNLSSIASNGTTTQTLSQQTVQMPSFMATDDALMGRSEALSSFNFSTDSSGGLFRFDFTHGRSSGAAATAISTGTLTFSMGPGAKGTYNVASMYDVFNNGMSHMPASLFDVTTGTYLFDN